MKFNHWTLALAAAGVVSLGSIANAEEAKQQVLTALSSTTLSGYVDTSAIWKFGTGNAPLPGRVFDGPTKQDGFNLNVVKLSLAKPLDEGQWSAGYQFDLLAGPDAAVFESRAGKMVGADDLAIQQAYVTMRAPVGNGLDFTMGAFDSVVGYESFDSYKNPNYSRSYGYAMQPWQHTGLLASYQVAEWLNIAGGVADTAFGAINDRPFRAGVGPAAESEKTYLGRIVITAPESMGFLKGATLYGGIVDGLAGASVIAPSASDVTHIYAGLTLPTPIEGFNVGACYDYSGNSTKGAVASYYANATALYLTYQATEKLKLANRAEYTTSSANNPFYTGGDYFADTFTVDYSLWANVISRVEFRWDRDITDDAVKRFGLADENALSLALNVIYKF